MSKVCNAEHCNELVSNPRAKYCSDKCKFTTWRNNTKSDPERLAKDKERRNTYNTTVDKENQQRRARAFYEANKENWPRQKYVAVSKRRHDAKIKLNRARRGTTGKKEIWAQGNCIVCNAYYVSKANGDIPRYCSKKCLRKESSARRRAAEAGVKISRIERYQIFKRDNFICQLCKEPMDMNCDFPNALYPTIDHIVALFLGGEHSMDNLQSAHFLCNSEKGYLDYAEFSGNPRRESFPILVGNDRDLQLLTGGNFTT